MNKHIMVTILGISVIAIAVILILAFKKEKERFTLSGSKYGVTAKIGMHGKEQEYDWQEASSIDLATPIYLSLHRNGSPFVTAKCIMDSEGHTTCEAVN